MQDKTRVVPLSALPDCRVDVCLAFIAPHKFTADEAAGLAAISELVPVIPVMAKVPA